VTTPQTLYVANRDDWRSWLQANHAIASEVWLIYFKKHTGQPSIPYDVAVEEALCFGWIDSTVRTIDDKRYMQRFTPRKDKSNWSELNKSRVRRLVAERRMTEAGLAKISAEALAEALAEQPPARKDARASGVEVPQYFIEAVRTNKRAWENFNRLAPSYRRQYVEWVMSAKREDTRRKRLKEAKERLSKNEKLGMK
jgi:uncharacterized protein YdeI (YjbR/CyaY-like superfamily)